MKQCTRYARGRILTIKGDLDEIMNNLASKYKKMGVKHSRSELEPIAFNALIEHNREEQISTDMVFTGFDYVNYKGALQEEKGWIEAVEVNEDKGEIKVVMSDGSSTTWDNDGYGKNGEYSRRVALLSKKYERYSGKVLRSKFMSDEEIQAAFLDLDMGDNATIGNIQNIEKTMVELDIAKDGSGFDLEHSNELTEFIDKIWSVNKEIRKLKVKVSKEVVDGLVEPIGEYNPNDTRFNTGGSIKILTSAAARQELYMSNQEVLAHESVHAALNWVFNNIGGVVGGELKLMAREMYAKAKKEITVEMLLPEHGGVYTETELKKAQELWDYMFEGKIGDYSTEDAEVRLQEFLALAATNRNVKRAMGKLSGSMKKVKPQENETVPQMVMRVLIDTVYKVLFALKSGRLKGKTLEEEASKLVVELARVQTTYGQIAAGTKGFNLADKTAEEIQRAFDKGDKKIRKLTDKMFEKLGLAPGDVATLGGDKKIEKILKSIDMKFARDIKNKGVLRRAWFTITTFPKLRLIYQISNIDPRASNRIMIAYSKLMYNMGLAEDSFVQRLIADFTAGRKPLQEITSMTMAFRSHIDRMRDQGYKGTLMHINEGMNIDLYAKKNRKYNEAVGSVLLGADLQSLNMSAKELKEVLKNPEKHIVKAEEKLLDEIEATDEEAAWLLRETESMAKYMATGIGSRTNSYNIAKRFGYGNELRDYADPKEVKVIDELGSLYALRYAKGREEFKELLDIDEEGVDHLLMLARGMTEATTDDWSESKVLHEMVKGQIHAMHNRNKEMVVAPIADLRIMKDKGYRLLRTLEADTADSDTTKHGLYYTSDAGLRSRVDGGTGLQRIQINGLLLSDKIRAANRQLTDKASFKKFIGVLEKAVMEYEMGNSNGNMHPVFNEEGIIVNFRYGISKEEEISQLDKETLGTELLARSYGQMGTQVMTDESNREFIDVLYDDMEGLNTTGGSDDTSHLYLKISANELDMSQTEREELGVYGKHRKEFERGKYGLKTEGEALWALLPPDAKEYIIERNNEIDGSIVIEVSSEQAKEIATQNKKMKEAYGNRFTDQMMRDWIDKTYGKKSKISTLYVNGRPPVKGVTVLPPQARREIYVRKDMLHQLFGYDELSITDMKLFNKMKESQKHKWIRRENWLKDLVGLLKSNVVVKLPSTIFGNIFSNMKFLWYSGMGPKKSAEYLLLSWKSLRQWKKDESNRYRLIRLVKGNSGKIRDRYRKELADVEARMEKNPLKKPMELGWYQSVTEDVNLTEDTNEAAKTGTRILNKVTGGKGFVHDVVQTAFLTRKSKLGQVLIHTTQESDFHFRVATYWFALEKIEAKYGTLESDEAKKDTAKAEKMITEDFINYSKVIENPFIQWLDRLGPEAFWKYFSGIQKVTTRRLHTNGARVIADWAGQKVFGLPSGIYQSSIISQWANRFSPTGMLRRVMGIFDSGSDLPLENLAKL